MVLLNSVRDIDLTPLPGKTYFNIAREWREEFIYFLLVDRFHDETARTRLLQPGRSRGIVVSDAFYGGKINGITQNLDYIAGLGCTAIWLSPIFENNAGAYHGYNINNYLGVDPNFGTKQDGYFSPTPTNVKWGDQFLFLVRRALLGHLGPATFLYTCTTLNKGCR